MEKMIDKQTMLNLIVDAKRTEPETGSFAEWLAEYLVEHLPTLTPPNEWVSVEDAMPPEHEPVLCVVNGRPKPNIILDEAYQLGSWNEEDGWIIDEYLEWTDADVLWWRMLPAPPDRRPPEGEDDEKTSD